MQAADFYTDIKEAYKVDLKAPISAFVEKILKFYVIGYKDYTNAKLGVNGIDEYQTLETKSSKDPKQISPEAKYYKEIIKGKEELMVRKTYASIDSGARDIVSLIMSEFLIAYTIFRIMQLSKTSGKKSESGNGLLSAFQKAEISHPEFVEFCVAKLDGGNVLANTSVLIVIVDHFLNANRLRASDHPLTKQDHFPKHNKEGEIQKNIAVIVSETIAKYLKAKEVPPSAYKGKLIPELNDLLESCFEVVKYLTILLAAQAYMNKGGKMAGSGYLHSLHQLSIIMETNSSEQFKISDDIQEAYDSAFKETCGEVRQILNRIDDARKKTALKNKKNGKSGLTKRVSSKAKVNLKAEGSESGSGEDDYMPNHGKLKKSAKSAKHVDISGQETSGSEEQSGSENGEADD